MTEMTKIRRALISVSDKSGLIELAQNLRSFEVEIISTGGTAQILRDVGIKVTEVSDVTAFPEILDGRVKTLHPKIHGALLAKRANESHISTLKQFDIELIDLVVVNLYPFESAIEKADVTLDEAIEQIDIGGPALIRSAAKNWRDVAVLTGIEYYDDILEEMHKNEGSISLETRRRLSLLAFARTSQYDKTIARFLAKNIDSNETAHLKQNDAFSDVVLVNKNASGFDGEKFPDLMRVELAKVSDLRYGENPHQRAAVYALDSNGIANAEQLHGKEMSFNNYIDTDAAWELVTEFVRPACAIIKHTNPSGTAIGENLAEAYSLALATDPVSAFGGIVAFNGKVDEAAARSVAKIFTEVIVAPAFDDEALAIFRSKKNLRVLRIADYDTNELNFRKISGGMLAQTRDTIPLDREDLRVVTKRQPTELEISSLLFAWRVCKHVKSNAIVFSDDRQTFGVGAGQMNRVDSVRIAATRAERNNFRLGGSALASDAFFPFRDGVDEAARFGVAAIIQPGGSVRDEETIAAANQHKIAMVFTGIRHFKH